MSECTPHDTPMVTRQVKKSEFRKIEFSDEIKNIPKSKVPYRETIGSLLYLARATRPDISYAVNYFSRRQLNLSERDWEEVKRVFAYLSRTADLGLIFRGNEEILKSFTDSSLMDCKDSKSTSGYVIKLFDDTIFWRSHKQGLVTKSSCEAEYLALSEVCQELISVDKAVRYIIGRTFYPVTILCDNKAALDNSQKEGSHKLKNFDDDIETIKNNLQYQEDTGKRRRISSAHGDFVKACVLDDQVIVKWAPKKRM